MQLLLPRVSSVTAKTQTFQTLKSWEILGTRGRPHQPFFLSENWDERSFMWCKNVGTSFFRLSQCTRLPDWQTDGRTDMPSQYRASHYMQSHGKNVPRISEIVGITSPLSRKPHFVAAFQILSLYPSLSLWLFSFFSSNGDQKECCPTPFFHSKSKLNLRTQTVYILLQISAETYRKYRLTHTVEYSETNIHAYRVGQKMEHF